MQETQGVAPGEYEKPGGVATRLGVTPRAVVRWIHEGISGPGGIRVRLRGVRVGHTFRIPVGAVDEFIRALNPTPSEDAVAARPRQSTADKHRKLRASAARAEFDRITATKRKK